MQAFGNDTRLALHLPDGPEQAARDQQFATPPSAKGDSPDKWVDSKTQSFLYDWDAEQEARKMWYGVLSLDSVQGLSLLTLR